MVRRRRQSKSDDDMGKVMHDLGVTGRLNRERRRLERDTTHNAGQALLVECPRCGAAAGEPCETADGTPHAVRLTG